MPQLLFDRAMVKTNVEKLFEVENIIRQSISGDIPMNITLNKTEALALESTTSPMQTTHIAKNRSEDKGDIEENEDN